MPEPYRVPLNKKTKAALDAFKNGESMLKMYALDKDRAPVPSKRPIGDRVDLTEVDGFRISTVFLGLAHGEDYDGRPILFETMVFPDGEWSDTYCERYAAWDEAKAGHKRITAEVRAGMHRKEAG